MTAHIRIDKDLEEDPRVWRLGGILFRQLTGVDYDPDSSNANHALHGVTCNAVLGGLMRLWRYADTHIDSSNALHATLQQLADVTQLSVTLLAQFPREWLLVRDDGTVELPDYIAKNTLTTKEKRRAQTRDRVRRWREKNSRPVGASDVTLGNARNAPSRVRARAHGRAGAREGNPNPIPVPETSERAAPANVSRGTPDGAVPMGDNLTRSADEWRAVPGIDPEAFDRWLPYLNRKGIQLDPEQRTIQATELAANGDAIAQRDVVEYCIGRGFKGLIPIADVRARKNGMTRNGASHPKQTSAERDAADPRWPRLRERAERIGFRAAMPAETADVYETQVRLAEQARP